MAEFFADLALRVSWAIPVGIALWFVARRFTHIEAAAESGTETSAAGRRAGWHRPLVLLACLVLLWGLLMGLGWLITRVLGPVRDVDATIMDWFGTNRTDAATAVAVAVDRIGDTPGIIVVILIAAPVAHAMTRRWAPALALVLAPAGETTVFLAAQYLTSRARPDIEHLAVEPVTSSFPSGHVAATFVTYGCIALLMLSWSRGLARFVAVGLAVALPLAVAWARLYQGMHFPSDVLVSLAFAPLWLAACWWALGPASRGELVRFGRAPDAESRGKRPNDVEATSPGTVRR